MKFKIEKKKEEENQQTRWFFEKIKKLINLPTLGKYKEWDRGYQYKSCRCQKDKGMLPITSHTSVSQVRQNGFPYWKNTNYSNSPITKLAIWIALYFNFKKLSKKEKEDSPDSLKENCLKCLKKNWHQFYATSFRKKKMREHFPTHFIKVLLLQYPN